MSGAAEIVCGILLTVQFNKRYHRPKFGKSANLIMAVRICVFAASLVAVTASSSVLQNESSLVVGQNDSTVSSTEKGVRLEALDDLLEIWEPWKLVDRWSSWLAALRDPALARMGASPDDLKWRACSSEVAHFLDALQNGATWAIQMADSSGRAPKGIFWGNRYWLGSRELCDYLDMTALSSSSLDDAPPFRVKFFVTGLSIKINSTKFQFNTKPILGVCLPLSCDVHSVHRLLLSSISASPEKSRSVKIKDIRPIGDEYVLMEDSIFIGLLLASAVSLVFILSATVYDLARTSEDELVWDKVILSFSVRTTLSKLFSQSVADDTVAALHGMRFLSLLWVMLAHSCLISLHLSDNQRFRERAEGHILYQILSSGGLSVDTFFFISGFLLSFLYFRSSINTPEESLFSGVSQGQSSFRKGVKHFAVMMVYRFVRLSPSYLAMIAVVALSMRWLRSNVLADLPFADADTCPRFWWRNALYIDTFFSSNERCMAWSWYLANDTQLYLVGSLLLVLTSCNFWLSTGFLFIIVGSSWLTTAAVAIATNHITSYRDPFAHYDQLYDKPWVRAGPYFIGIITGWLVWRAKPWLSGLSLMTLAAGWTISTVALLTCIFGLYGAPLESAVSTAYASLSHTAWGLAIAWVLVVCAAGRAKTVNAILAWRPLYPLSRLSYCTYLVHPQIMRVVLLLVDSSVHLSRGLLAVQFIGFTIISFMAALLLSILFEAPFVALFRIIQPRRLGTNGVLTERKTEPSQKQGLPTSWSAADFPY